MPKIEILKSPNFGTDLIEVEYVVIHYTACSLERSLEIFRDPATGVVAHFVVDTDGRVVDFEGSLEGPVRRGAHAGKSRLRVGGRDLVDFNQFSIGIELVNLNGNLRPYSDAQYQALSRLVRRLQKKHPALRSPDRFVGHEQIAGFRGKVDPGHCFDWSRFFAETFSQSVFPVRRPVLTPEELAWLREQVTQRGLEESGDWPGISLDLERKVALRQNASEPST